MADVNKIVAGTRVKNDARTVLNNGGKLSTSVNPDRKSLDLYSKTIYGQKPKVELINMTVRGPGQGVSGGDGGSFLVPESLRNFRLVKVTATFGSPIAESGDSNFTIYSRTPGGIDTNIGGFTIVDNSRESYATLSSQVTVGNTIVVILDSLNSEPAPDGLSILLEFAK